MARVRIDMTETKDCEGCGKAYARTVAPSGKVEPGPTFRKRRFCGARCSNYAKQQRSREVAEDLEWIIGTDNPVSIAKRLGYGEPKSLLKALRRAGRHDLSQRFGREFERFMAPLTPEPELSVWYA